MIHSVYSAGSRDKRIGVAAAGGIRTPSVRGDLSEGRKSCFTKEIPA